MEVEDEEYSETDRSEEENLSKEELPAGHEEVNERHDEATELQEKYFTSPTHSISMDSEDFFLTKLSSAYFETDSEDELSIGSSRKTSVDSDDLCLRYLFAEEDDRDREVFSIFSITPDDIELSNIINVDLLDEAHIKSFCGLFYCGTCYLTGTELRKLRTTWDLRACCQENILEQGFEVLCENCKRKYVSSKILQGIPFIRCPSSVECEQHLEQDEIRALVSDELFEKYQKLLVDISKDPSKKTCPGCSKIYESSKPNEVQVSCTGCMMSWCFQCHAPWHENITCKKFRKGDRSLKIWAKNKGQIGRKARTCPKCKIFIQKNGGCDHMTCNRCQTDFCYRCGGRYMDFGLLGNHHSKLSVFGCKYEYKPDHPVQRIATRGAIFTTHMLALPAIGGLLAGAGCVALVGLMVAAPVLVPYKIVKNRRKKKQIPPTWDHDIWDPDPWKSPKSHLGSCLLPAGIIGHFYSLGSPGIPHESRLGLSDTFPPGIQNPAWDPV